MKFFIDAKERKESGTTCYFEFQKGLCDDKCWKEDSVYISDSVWDEYETSEVFENFVPDFDYYGITKIDKNQWTKIVEFCKTNKTKCAPIIIDVKQWVEDCFANNDCFSIWGM